MQLHPNIVLWFSRHDPLPAQLDYLERKLKDYKLIQHKEPLNTAEEAIKLASQFNASYIVPVLPLSFIAYLVDEAKKYDITVLRAEMILVHNCTKDPCPDFDPYTDVIITSRSLRDGSMVRRHFRFDRFTVLKGIKIETEEW